MIIKGSTFVSSKMKKTKGTSKEPKIVLIKKSFPKKINPITKNIPFKNVIVIV